jgi:hypothetical protein
MRSASLFTVTLLTLATALTAQVNARSAQQQHRFQTEPQAAGCVVSTLTCGISDSGELAPGDCTFSDGTYYDVWRFSGAAGQLVTITVTPIEATYTKPQVELVPPIGDASLTPIVQDGKALSIKYALASTGTWEVFVETNSLPSHGKYSISLQCGTQPSSVPQSCVAQPLACDQAYDWFVTASSCQFSGSGSYAPFNFKMTKGDYVGFTAHSDAYDPYVSIYSSAGGQPLMSGFGRRSTSDAAVYFTAPSTGTYGLAVYGPNGQPAGEFFLNSSCINVCSAPTITTQPVNQLVPFGGTASLSIAAPPSNGNFASYSWYQFDDFPLFVDSGPTLTVRNVTATQHFYAIVSNACGQTNSALAAITPMRPAKSRAVKH